MIVRSYFFQTICFGGCLPDPDNTVPEWEKEVNSPEELLNEVKQYEYIAKPINGEMTTISWSYSENYSMVMAKKDFKKFSE